MSRLLDAVAIRKRFGGVRAVDGVDLHIDEGEILGLIGPNGAGKTTLFNCLSGVVPPSGGSLAYAGEVLIPPAEERVTARLRRLAQWQFPVCAVWWFAIAIAILCLRYEFAFGLELAFDREYADVELLIGLAVLAGVRAYAGFQLGRRRGWAWGMHFALACCDLLLVLICALSWQHLDPRWHPSILHPPEGGEGGGIPSAPLLLATLPVLSLNAILLLIFLPRRAVRTACGLFLRPDAIARRGIARTFQNIRLFTSLSALDNVVVGAHRRQRDGLRAFLELLFLRFPGRGRWWSRHRDRERALEQEARELLAFVGLEGREWDGAGTFSYGQQRRLEIARALAAEPALLLLDEPAAGMNDTETRELVALIRRIRDRGIAVLLIEHDMKLVMQLCDRIHVIDHGATLAVGTPNRVRRDPRVVEAYLGSGAADA